MTGDAITRMLFTEREIQRGNRFFLTSNRLQYMSNADKPEPYGSQIPARGEYYNVNGPEEKDTTT